MEENVVRIYVDGACRGNQAESNIGSYAAILIYNGHEKELSMGFRNITNNQMEIKAVIAGLREMKRTDLPIEVYSDSAYVVNAINNKWIDGWAKNGWIKKDGKEVKNQELFQELFELFNKFDNIKIIKIKGHAGHFGNERADRLCNLEMDRMG